MFWTGYKVHISETCSDKDDGDGGQPGQPGPLPNIITNVATTDAVPDRR